MKKQFLFIISLLLCIPVNGGSGHPVGNPNKPKMELFPKQQPDGSWGYQGQNGPKPQQQQGYSFSDAMEYCNQQRLKREEEDRIRQYYIETQGGRRSPIPRHLQNEPRSPTPPHLQSAMGSEKISPNFEEVALAKKEQEDMAEALQHKAMAEQKKLSDEREKERAQKAWDDMVERNIKAQRDLEAQQNTEKIIQALNGLFSSNTTQTTSTQTNQSLSNQISANAPYLQQVINELNQGQSTSASPTTQTTTQTTSTQTSGNNQPTPQPSNTSMPNPLNAASQALGGASDIIFGIPAKGNPVFIPAVTVTPEVISAIIASTGAIAAAHKAKQDALDKMPTRTTNTQTQPTQDAAKEESLSTKTWLAKKVDPLPTIPELPEVVTPHQAAKEHSIDAAMQAEAVIAPTPSTSESTPATNGSNLAKVAIFQQLAGQSAAKETDSISFPFPRYDTHDWDEPTPNTRIEHKSGNTQLKTSRGNTNYTFGTDILFSPITYMLRKMVDSQQPRQQEDHTQQHYEKRYLDRSTPEQLFRSKKASDNYIKASEAYENGGRYSPGRTRYNKKLEIAKEILAAERDCPGSISESTFQDVKIFFENDQKYRENGERAIQKHHERAQKESNKVERRLEKKQAKRAEKAKKNASSNSGNNGGKGPKKDDNEKKERIINIITKTEAAKRIKDRYEPRSDGKYYRRAGKEPLKDANGKNIEVLEFDHLHNDWEAYGDTKCSKHVGSVNPSTLEIYKKPVANRTAMK
jgi:hypothetical protein